MYNNIQELPVAMHETGEETLYPQVMTIDLVVKMQDRSWYIAHCDQSLSFIENIERILTILSDNRITFKK